MLLLVTGWGIAQDAEVDDVANSTQHAGQLIDLFFKQQTQHYIFCKAAVITSVW